MAEFYYAKPPKTARKALEAWKAFGALGVVQGLWYERKTEPWGLRTWAADVRIGSGRFTCYLDGDGKPQRSWSIPYAAQLLA